MHRERGDTGNRFYLGRFAASAVFRVAALRAQVLRAPAPLDRPPGLLSVAAKGVPP